MRIFSTSFVLGWALVFVPAAPGAWASDDVLEGWDNYKFGMTIEQVRAVPGIAWGEIEHDEVKAYGMKFTFLTAVAPAKIGTATYNLRVYFEPDTGLARMNFEDKTPVKSIAACERKFTDALGELERRYGAFAATSKEGKTDTPFGTLIDTRRNAPTGSSKYSHLRATMQFKPNGPVSLSIELNAIRKFGDKWVSLRSISPADITRCEVTIGYTDTSAR